MAQPAGDADDNPVDESKDRAFPSIQAVFASLQKADMKAKLGAGRRERAAQGLPYGGQVPYGYDRVLKGPFVVNEAQAQTYAQMMDWVIEGLVRKRSRPGLLARALQVRGAWPIGPNHGRRNHREPSTAGHGSGPARRWREVGNRTRSAADHHSRALGAGAGGDRLAQAVSDNRRRHVLAGLLKCSACGYTLRYMVQRRQNVAGERKPYPYYKCEHNRACTGRYAIAEGVALEEIAEQINERLRDTTEWTRPVPASQIGEVENRIGELEAAAADAGRKVKRAHTAWVDADEAMAGIALEELHARQQTLKTIQAELDEARRGYAQAMTAPSDEVDLDEIRALLLGWETLPDEEKRMVLEAVVDHAVVLPKGRGPRLDVHWVAAPKLPERSPGI